MRGEAFFKHKTRNGLLLSILFFLFLWGCNSDNPLDEEETSSSSEEEISSINENSSSSEENTGSLSSSISSETGSSSRETDSTSSEVMSSSINGSSAVNSSSSADSISSSELMSSSVSDSLSSNGESSSSSTEDHFDADNPLKEFFEQDDLPESILDISLFQDDDVGNAYLEKIIPYEVNSELWSDSLYKKRFFYVPDGQSMTLNSNTLTYPNGTVFIKDFYLREYLDENSANPDSGLRKLETRFLFKKSGEWKFITYKWNENEKNALPLPNGEVVEQIPFWESKGSGQRSMKHTFPSQEQCAKCHIQDKEVLGFIPAQLNDGSQLQSFISQNKIQGSVNNSMHTWASILDENAGLQHRSRSYLAANCSHCHSENGRLNGATFSAVDFTYTSVNQPIVYDTMQSNIPGHDYARVLFTQRTERSAIVYRMEERQDTSKQMPNLGTHIKDVEAINVIKQWIDSLPDNWDSLAHHNDTTPWNPDEVSIMRTFGNVSIPRVLALHQIPGSEDFLAVSQHTGEVHKISNSGGSWDNELLHDVGNVETGNEEGILGLCFHPDYEQNGLYYLNYQPTSINGDVRVEERRLNLNTREDEGYSRVIMETVLQSGNTNHNGGTIAFGWDGYLYVSYGDGGRWNSDNSMGIDDLSGTIIRVDVDNPANGNEYSIPSDNPYVGSNRLDEVFIWGLRNPWRMSFSKINGDLYIGDVGNWNPSREEVDYIAYDENFTKGYNMGWPCREGKDIVNASAENCDNATEPVYAYNQEGGAIMGGHVLDRPGNPYHGAYIFAEYGNNARVMAIMKKNDEWEYKKVTDAPGFSIYDISTNHEGNETYLLYSNGQIHRMAWEDVE